MEDIMDLIQTNITPADGEQSVRTYCCTYYKSKFLGIQTNGYLGVTNKRVIYQATGSSTGGKSVIQSEVPIADVSGLSSFKGIYFSLLHLLGVLILSGFIVSMSTTLIGLIAVALESYSAFQFFTWVIVVGGIAGSFLVPVKSIWRPVLAGVGVAGLVALGGGSFISNFSLLGLLGGRRSSGGWQLILALFAGIYALLCAFWYARRPTFALEINSKGGASTPISISSVSGLLNISASKSLNAEPAQDAEKMLQELGALILDIQMLGDYGINKWKLQ
jgi:hypothetical protein